MFARSCVLVAVLVGAGSCGPDAALLPRSGVYNATIELPVNDCKASDPYGRFANGFLDAVVHDGERLRMGHAERAWLDDDHGRTPPASWASSPLEHDPETGQYVKPATVQVEVGGCLHAYASVVAEVIDERTIRAIVTDVWEDDSGCPGLVGDRCTTVYEHTYTLVEACDECTFDELEERALELSAERNAGRE